MSDNPMMDRQEDAARRFRESQVLERHEKALSQALARVEELEEMLSDAQEGAERIVQWCDAYPVDIFIPPSKEDVKLAVAAIREHSPISSDALHAKWARHLLDGVRGHAEQSLAALNEEGSEKG